MRLFVAVPIPGRVRATLAETIGGVVSRGEGLRWGDQEHWHLTLAFLGEVPDERLGEVRTLLDRTVGAAAPWQLALEGAGRFGGRVLWVGVDEEPAGTLATLAGRVQQTLVAAGFPMEEREPHPHLTVARSTREREVTADDVRALTEAVAPIDRHARVWKAQTVELWRSSLGRGPARYEVVHEVPLGAD